MLRINPVARHVYPRMLRGARFRGARVTTFPAQRGGDTPRRAVLGARAGTYVIHCAIECGAGHSNMTLTIMVK
jgi:hypothetical protein